MYSTNCFRLFKLLLLSILASANLPTSSSCNRNCGGIPIPFPFGIGKNCYLDKPYEIECRRKSTSSTKPVPFLAGIKKEVVSISLPAEGRYYSSSGPQEGSPVLSFGTIRVRSPIISTGCFSDGEERAESLMNLTGSPFSLEGSNKLVGIGCKGKVSLTNIDPKVVGCELHCNTSQDSRSLSLLGKTRCMRNALTYGYQDDCSKYETEETGCNGKGCCQADLPAEPQNVIGFRIESNDGNSTTRENCSVAFLTDRVYTFSKGTKPEQILSTGDATLTLTWIIQTKNNSYLSSLACKDRNDFSNDNHFAGTEMKCLCDKNTVSNISYARCACRKGYQGNPYIAGNCTDINECETQQNTCKARKFCKNTPGGYHCVGDKTVPILIGVSSGFGVLLVVVGVWWLRKFLIKTRITKRKNNFFKRNGGLLLQQELGTSEGNVDRTIIFSSRELEKATENFSADRVLGQGGQGTVYKGMLVDGRTVAVKKSKAIDEDRVQEFINEVVILSQINHRHIVKLLGCCLETEVPILVYEFILNGNLFQHIHEESDDYAMIWKMRLRIAVDIAGALSYLHSSASFPVYHRDIKSANILLDEKYRAKVSDFGTSRSITIDQTHWTTVISGTVGYVDPEYYRSSQYTEKSDVYSFGVILAELITGDKPVITVPNTQKIISLAEHFRLAMKEKRLLEIIDARIRDDCKPEQVMAVANLAKKCLSWKGKNRPNMREVFTELERTCTSLDDSNVQIQIDDEEEEEEEEDMKIIIRSDSWSIGVTAPALASSSSSNVEPLFPLLTR